MTVELVLGPQLRCVDGDRATVWVECDAACEVSVTAESAVGRARTTSVAGRHYAVIVVADLPDASTVAYQVALDDRQAWPDPESDLPPSVIRTEDRARPVRVVFGSCRVEAPMEPPWDRPAADDDRGMGVDALDALARRLARQPPDALPDLLVMLGDQVYADLVVHSAPDHDGDDEPPHSVADLDEYVELYHQTWSHPFVRWLLSTVPSVMVFDDHDMVDDWNLSQAWLEHIVTEPWWDDRVAGGFISYWLYQHWGNLSPSELTTDPLAREVAQVRDATDLLHRQVDGWRLDRATGQRTRWSTSRDLNGTAAVRLVLLDTRNRRHLVEGERDILDHDEAAWLHDRARADRDGVDHLLVGSSLPWLLPPGVHDMERWAEALGAGRWGPPGRWLAEHARRAGDLEHWPSFGDSFDHLARLLSSVATGEQGPAPSSVLVLSGDVHFSYVAPVDLGVDGARVVQLVCSPIRNGVPANLQRVLTMSSTRLGSVAGRIARRTTGRGEEPLAWSLTGGPWFGNGIATLTLDGPTATVRFECSRHDHDGAPDLFTVHEERLAGPPS